MSNLLTPLDPDHLADLTDIQVLTGLVRMGGGPELDSFELAHDLLHHCHDLAQVLALPTDELFDFPGLGEDPATFLLLISEMMERYARPPVEHLIQIRDRAQLCRLLLPHFYDLTTERLCILCVDQDWHLLTAGLVSQGHKTTVSMAIRRMVELVMSHPTWGVVVAHNHPDGSPIFSERDLRSTEDLARKLALLEVSLLDHYLIAGKEMISLRLQLEALGERDTPFSSMINGPQGDLP